MQERNGYWSGVLVGAAVGVAVSTFLRNRFFRSPLRLRGPAHLLQFPSPARHSDSLVTSADPVFRQDEHALPLRRESPESAGSPLSVAPQTIEPNLTGFERSGGSPGSRGGAERISLPGHPEHAAELTDPAAPVRPSTRAINLAQS